MKVIHEIEPVWDAGSKVLILGTMPSPASRKAGFFYMHAQNRFWQIMQNLFCEKFEFKNNAPEKELAVRERRDFLLRHNIALWDVLSECSISGASDSTIKEAVPNDFTRIFSGADIKQLFCTGKTAFNLYKKYCSKKYNAPFTYLPSTSPANRARWQDSALVAEYEQIKSFLNESLT
ncbi:MAG: DNA-deoxyinosine glycosylase [Treponema sp.]